MIESATYRLWIVRREHQSWHHALLADYAELEWYYEIELDMQNPVTGLEVVL